MPEPRKATSVEIKYDSVTFWGEEPLELADVLGELGPARVLDAQNERGGSELVILSVAASYFGLKVLDSVIDNVVSDAYSFVKAKLVEWNASTSGETGQLPTIVEFITSLDDIDINILVHPIAGEGHARHVVREIRRHIEDGSLDNAQAGINYIKVPMIKDDNYGWSQHLALGLDEFNTRYWGVGFGPDRKYESISYVYDSEDRRMVEADLRDWDELESPPPDAPLPAP